MVQTSPIPLTIDIRRITKDDPKPKMDPIHPLEVRPGDLIHFTAPDSELRVFFPNPFVPEPLPFRIESSSGDFGILWATPEGVLVWVSANSQIDVRVLPAHDLPKKFPYSVYCKKANAFAEGKSDPVIIIL